MILKEYIKGTQNFYEIHGLHFTPSSDYLFNNFNIHLISWINTYGECEIINIRKDVNDYGSEFDYVTIDNSNV